RAKLYAPAPACGKCSALCQKELETGQSAHESRDMTERVFPLARPLPAGIRLEPLFAVPGMLMLGFSICVAAEVSNPKKVATCEGISAYQFAHGLRVLLFPDNSQSKVTVNMTVLVGSRQEGYGETGMAHLLEHMVFKGTPNHPHVPKALQDHGAVFNGSTS